MEGSSNPVRDLFLGVSDTALIPPLLPSIAEELLISPGRAGTVVTAYALAAAAFALVLGTASDRIGRKRLMCLALLVFGAASLITYRSSYFSILLTARLLTGLSAGTLSTLAFSYAGDHYPYQQRGRAMGIISMAYFLVFVISVPAGTLIAARYDWRWIFLGLAVASAVMFLVTISMLPRTSARPDTHLPRMFSLTSDSGSRRRNGRRIPDLGWPCRLSDLRGCLALPGTESVWSSSNSVHGRWAGRYLSRASLGVAGRPSWEASPDSRCKPAAGTTVRNRLQPPVGTGALLFVGVLSITAAARQAPLHALTTQLVSSEVRGSYMAVRNAASQLGIAVTAAVSAAAFDQFGFGTVAWITALHHDPDCPDLQVAKGARQ